MKARKDTFPRQNVATALVLLNEDHEIYDPETMAFLLTRALSRSENNAPLYEHVDFIIYLSERHATFSAGKMTFPALIIEGAPCEISSWKSDLARYFVERWALWNDAPCFDVRHGSETQFTTIDAIPDQVPLHEKWRIEYRRNPYLRQMSHEELLDRFQEIHVVSSLSYLHGAPLKVPPEASLINMECFTHMMLELAHRAIPVTDIPTSVEQEVAAVGRLGLPVSVGDWFKTLRKGTE